MKEFPNKDDAAHWIDLLKALHNKNLLKGQFDLMKTAAANRKASQDAYEKILAAKQVFVPEQDPNFQQKPCEGKDIWGNLFTKYEEPKKPAFPESTVRVHSNSIEKVTLDGYKAPLVGELWGWHHQQLGWRVTDIITHDGSGDFSGMAKDSSLVHLGFLRCAHGDSELSDDDKKEMQSIADKQPVIAIVITYPASLLM